MNPLSYARVSDISTAIPLGLAERAKYIGGGMNLVDLMRETLERPASLVDVTGLSTRIEEREDGSLLIGAAVRNTAVAGRESVRRR
jgi:xanthine dehydrogenase YagS FAD-binding subunit